MIIGVIGAGTMGSGIAQIASTQGCQVILFDKNTEALQQSEHKLEKILNRLIEKSRITTDERDGILNRITYSESFKDFKTIEFCIEAIVENLDIKQQVFKDLEQIVSKDAIIATNTSSLSIASIASALKHPERCLGVHFFNPAPLMPLVEIIPAVQTDEAVYNQVFEMINSWGKAPVKTKDTPGFIVNRVARPFYGEALRILEEGIADVATIDWAITELGHFKMGPFQLMDFIGHDVNYAVTETVFKAFYYDPRYKPSFTQKRLAEAGYLGRKSGKGFYDYNDKSSNPKPTEDEKLGYHILNRILVMLINEAADALYLNIASAEDIELAMTKGVNYPKGLLSWANERGVHWCVQRMDDLYHQYHEDRYRCSPLLRKLNAENKQFKL
ncbi:3-hydroxyacyl-CoA dehydrogenase NAD-binding domain-containing protein [Flavobacteriaceae bacterium 14752]|uniref:3-hydroxyacyl-CoA dehydrogenase NAD-binding domain-containing protein n=1 Tax=Mesohalobacter salilacus TaxID=2491711 RepID=UPI000F63CD2C|nr:3-hydroxybutyryl-CoA dehydrogenase [Flavobacteriaceae bacterium 14752]